MRTLIFCSVGLLSSCITVAPAVTPEIPEVVVSTTRYVTGPIPPLMSPPSSYDFISPNSPDDLSNAERYAKDLITYSQYVRNHLKYVIGKYELDNVSLKVRCIANTDTTDLVLPELPDISAIPNDKLSTALIEHIEQIYAAVNMYNLETISLRDRICVD